MDIITGICLRHNPGSLPGTWFLIHNDEIQHEDIFPDLPGFIRSDEAGPRMLRYPSPATPPVRFGKSKIVMPPARDLISVTEHRSSPLRDWRVFYKSLQEKGQRQLPFEFPIKSPSMNLLFEDVPRSPVGSGKKPSPREIRSFSKKPGSLTTASPQGSTRTSCVYLTRHRKKWSIDLQGITGDESRTKTR